MTKSWEMSDEAADAFEKARSICRIVLGHPVDNSELVLILTRDFGRIIK